jgi:ABC-type multidrug transport system fused ATPase/permease subunit
VTSSLLEVNFKLHGAPMQMDFGHWMALESATRQEGPRTAFDRRTLSRIVGFARPHRRALALFLGLSVTSAVLTVAAPVLAGLVVNEIVAEGSADRIVLLALAIAAIALLDATTGLAERWQSARIGEHLILDLRRSVFAHVQRLPVAFFTRTRTGALVSRLDNDVIGAQRAFTWTLSSVVGNLIALVLTVAVMVRLSWQITALALLLLPVFVVPARRMGSRLAHLQREAAAHNSAMTTQMTERFSAPGATLVKLFGRPEREEAEFARRAEHVAVIGVRSAMAQYAFLTALALVSALALALVYGLGGWLAVRGSMPAGRW